MQIAFYDIGDDIEPQGTLHDGDGAPLLDPDEVLLFNQPLVHAEVRTRKNPAPEKPVRFFWLTERVFFDLGPGTLYRTDRRMIYLREPNFAAHIKNADGATLQTASGRALIAKHWMRQKWKEGFSVRMENIQRFKRKKKRVVLLVEDEGVPYKCVLRSRALAQRL